MSKCQNVKISKCQNAPAIHTQKEQKRKNAKKIKVQKNSLAPAISSKQQNSIKRVKYKTEKYKNS